MSKKERKEGKGTCKGREIMSGDKGEKDGKSSEDRASPSPAVKDTPRGDQMEELLLFFSYRWRLH